MISPDRRLIKVTLDLTRSPLFADMAGILMMGKKEVVPHIPTACTNGRDEQYGEAFIASLDDKGLAFVVVHEGEHKMRRDLFTWSALAKINPHVANMAMDHVINLSILKRDPSGSVVQMPTRDGKPIGLADKRFANMTVKEVFYILLKEQEENGGGGGGDFPVLDDHDWDGAKELTKEELERLTKEVDQAIRQGQIIAQKMHGKGHGDMDRSLYDLLYPKVDWREALREFVSSTCAGRDYSSWRKPNRRYLAQDIIMPSLISERVESMLLAIDTSGSIGGPELSRFMSEVTSIADSVNPEKVDLVYWDARVAGHEVYPNASIKDMLSSTKPKGGGGTDPTCIPVYMQEHGIRPQCVVVLTDGYVGSWGDWDVPVLWCIVGNNNATAPVGQTIHVDN